MKQALISTLSVATLLLVGSCGVAIDSASASSSGPVVVTRIDGNVLYKFCDGSRIVYFTSTGGVSVGAGGSC